MSVTVTNNHNLPAPVAAWLEKDSYDYDPRKNTRSASAIIKSAKKAKLSSMTVRDPNIHATWDVMDMLASRRGTAIHDALETAAEQLILDGFDLIQEVRLEYELDVDGVMYLILGKFDIIEDKVMGDWKTESTYSWGDAVKLRDRKYQLSIYVWLCHRIGIPCSPSKGTITSIFGDWSKAAALAAKDNPENYPSTPIKTVPVAIMQRDAIEAYMRKQIRAERDMVDPNSVMCTREELWLKEATWGFYGKPENKKASKNFTGPGALMEANIWKQSKGGGGVIKEKPQKAKACSYCLGRFNCNQFEILKSQGLVDDED